MASKGARPPSHIAYYVALVVILCLLLMLCCYFFYYFISKVKELSEQMSPTQTPSTSRPKPTASYPIQPVVRESATAMAKLCKNIPQPAGVTTSTGKGDTVFPTSTSPEAQQTDTGDIALSGVPPDTPTSCEVR